MRKLSKEETAELINIKEKNMRILSKEETAELIDNMSEEEMDLFMEKAFRALGVDVDGIKEKSEAEFQKINALPSDQREKEMNRVVDNSINFLENFLCDNGIVSRKNLYEK